MDHLEQNGSAGDRGPEGSGGAGPAPSGVAAARAGLSLGHWVLLVGLGILCTAVFLIFLPFWVPLFLAAVVTTLTYPTYLRVLRLVGGHRKRLASAITCLGFTLVVLIPTTWVFLNILSEAPKAVRGGAADLLRGLDHVTRRAEPGGGADADVGVLRKFLDEHPDMEKRLNGWKSALATIAGEAPPDSTRKTAPSPEQEGGPVDGIAALPEPSRVTVGNLGGLLDSLASLATSLLRGAAGFLFKLFLMLFLLFYFLKDGPQILGSLRSGIPVSSAYQDKLIRTFDQVTRSIVRGTFLTALCQGAVAGVAFVFLGKQAFFWGAATALSALVPVVGTTLITVPMTLSFAIGGQWGHAIAMAAVAAFIGTMDNIVRPLFVQGGLRLHPVWILLAVLGGISVFGPPGLVIGPLAVALTRTVLALVIEDTETAS